ncbi:VOC family protein [Stakelama saccharophila]|uniref:VOC family protein n=1 Tax=Stakelama saccharophila TaxID=3075605 RepID=A0ABZ0BB26_9SPHN|nr:VOC family protein [Stakelama sp. W311]WNO54465.1 VOC family protein [Stakelama sp. W311]
MTKLSTCVWCNYTAEEQAKFYTALLPDSRITRVQRTPADTPSQKAGDVIVVELELLGQQFILLNGGDMFRHSEAVSFVIPTKDQAETDHYWNAIVDNGGAESMCGWCKDKWGISWQVTPDRLIELAYDNPDADSARRAMEAMMTMRKIDIAAIERAAEAA